jgi:hypothetical protein
MSVTYDLHNTFGWKVRNFPEEVYPLFPEHHLTKLLHVLLEDAGIGQLKKLQTVARLAEALGGTQYSDLDFFFGTFLNFPRTTEEQYQYDPFHDQLTSAQWDQVHTRDALYRERLKLFLTATMYGGTQKGLQMAAEAACGYPCDILEVWRFAAGGQTVSGIGVDSQGLPTYPGRLTPVSSPKEFVVTPHLPSGVTSLPMSQRTAIYRTVNRLKPVNTFCTVDEHGLQYHHLVIIRHVASPSEYFEIRKYVTGINVPPPPPVTKYYWIKNGVEVEAPTFAGLRSQAHRRELNLEVIGVDCFDLDVVSTYTPTTARVKVVEQGWGPWRLIEIVDAPDNYPNGKYAGDPAKYDERGNYIFAWESQRHYIEWFKVKIVAVGGQVEVDRFRLPSSLEISPTPTGDTKQSLATTKVQIESVQYGV